MFNYIKSEFYRISHSAMIYVCGLAFMAVPALINIMLYGFVLYDPYFLYATTSFSYSNLVIDPMIFCMSALFLVYALYEGNKKNGNFKNVITAGISREKIFLGQIIVCLVVSAIILILTVASYILSARLLLRNEGPVTEMDLLMECFAVAPIAVAALILAIIVVMLCDKTLVGLLCWFGILFVVPDLLFYIGFKVQPVRVIAMWLPRNFFSGMQVNLSVCEPIWDTARGLTKCLISGFAGIGIFGIAGWLGLRRKEL